LIGNNKYRLGRLFSPLEYQAIVRATRSGGDGLSRGGEMTTTTSSPRADGKRVVIAATILIVVLLLAFGALIGSLVLQGYSDTRARALQRADNAAQIVATNSQWITQTTRLALRRIDGAAGIDLKPGDSTVAAEMTAAIDGLPGDPKAYLVAADGTTLYSSDPEVQPINITDRDYFSALAGGASSYVSPLLISRLNGKQIFVFSRRLERNGAFAGAAMISYDVELLRDIWAALGFDTMSTVSLIRRDGQLVARYPLADRPLDMSGYVLFTDYLKQSPTGNYPAISPLDGVERLVSYRLVPGTDFVAVASVSAAVTFASFWYSVTVFLAIVVPVLIALAIAGFWIAKLIQRAARRQAELERALDQNTMLLRETHHRVKNNIQSIGAMIRMHDIAENVKMDLRGRLSAMSAVHEHIYSKDDFAETRADVFLPTVVEPVRDAYGAKADITFEVEPVAIHRDSTTSLALLLNELVSNVFKYAMADGRAGKITVGLRKLDGDKVRLWVEDDGPGFTLEGARRGMGTRLIEGVVSQFSGTYAYSFENGTRFAADLNLNGPAQAE
jgi:two-component sensor histidine kinase